MESIYYLFVYLFAVWFLSISSVLPMRDEIIWCRWYLDFFAAVPILNKGRVNYCCWRYQVSPNCSSSSNWSRNNLNWEQVAISTYENGGVWILVGAQLGYTPCFKSIFFLVFWTCLCMILAWGHANIFCNVPILLDVSKEMSVFWFIKHLRLFNGALGSGHTAFILKGNMIAITLRKVVTV